MSTTSANRIRQSYRLLAPQMSRMTGLMYERMFARHPEVRALFKTDMTQQGGHLTAALALIVMNLPMLDVLGAPLRELGELHARAGVRPEHYPIVKDAMLFAFSTVAGDAWSDELARDWGSLIDRVSGYMLAGARLRHSPAD